jgi:hypothetical protein
MRRVLVLLAAAATFLVLAVGPAAADPGNTNTLSFTLNCGSAGTVDAVFELSSSDSFHIVQFSSNFLWKSLDYVTPDGQTGRIERGSQRQPLHRHRVLHPLTATAGGSLDAVLDMSA